LFVLTPNYQRACYLEGKVTNTTNNTDLNTVKVDLMGTDNFSISNYSGDYFTGAGQPGVYDVRFTRAGCSTQIFTNITFVSGQTTVLNAGLDCANLTGITDADTQQPYLVAKPSVFNGQTSLSFFTGENGISQSNISIYDMTGHLVNQWNIETPYGEVVVGDNLPAGMYLVNLNNANFAHSIKILKNQ
jgi:hypothetical protein